jgi:hypothetical protein
MPSLPKLHEYIVRSSQKSVPASAVARVPEAVPSVDVQLRQPFHRPQPLVSFLHAASVDLAVTSHSRPEPAPLPSVDSAIPHTKPSPPRESVSKQ